MSIDQYKGNSDADRKETQRASKVISGNARIKKKTEIQKFTSLFIPDDMDSVRTSISSIIVSGIKRIVLDTITTMLTGEARSSYSSSRRASRVSYDKYYEEPVVRSNGRMASVMNTDDVIFETRSEARDVLDAMDDIISRYRVASVGDFYDLAGLTYDYTLDSYGWDNLRNAKISETRDGYIIRMPKARPIK